MVEQFRAAAEPGAKLALRNAIAVRCWPFLMATARTIAESRRARAARLEPEDFITWGVQGLFTAMERYERSRGVKFLTYAGRRVAGAMKDQIREEDWMPRLARRRGESRKLVSLSSRANRQARDGKSTTLSQVLPDPVDPRRRRRAVEIEVFRKHLACLPVQLRPIVEMLFVQEMNMREIGLAIGLSESRISQMMTEAMRILKADLSRRRVFRPSPEWKE